MTQLKCQPCCVKPRKTGQERACSLLSNTVDGKLSGFLFWVNKRRFPFSIKNKLDAHTRSWVAGEWNRP